ncbi:MAG: hypothetical protein ABH817_02215 [archaeon]
MFKLFKKKRGGNEAIIDLGRYKSKAPESVIETKPTEEGSALGFLGNLAGGAESTPTHTNIDPEKIERLQRRFDRVIERMELMERKMDRVENRLDLKY